MAPTSRSYYGRPIHGAGGGGLYRSSSSNNRPGDDDYDDGGGGAARQISPNSRTNRQWLSPTRTSSDKPKCGCISLLKLLSPPLLAPAHRADWALLVCSILLFSFMSATHVVSYSTPSGWRWRGQGLARHDLVRHLVGIELDHFSHADVYDVLALSSIEAVFASAAVQDILAWTSQQDVSACLAV